MPGALVDLSVAARLGLRELARRVRGQRAAAPDLGRFRAELERALARVPRELVAEHVWLELPASEPPWRDSGIALARRRGGRPTSPPGARWCRMRSTSGWRRGRSSGRASAPGPIRSSSRDSDTLRAEQAGRLYLGNYFPNDWKDASGARLQDDAVYAGVSGTLGILVVRWRGRAADGLAALAAAGDALGVVASERERLALGDPAPPGWRYLWHLGDAEIFRPGAASTARRPSTAASRETSASCSARRPSRSAPTPSSRGAGA